MVEEVEEIDEDAELKRLGWDIEGWMSLEELQWLHKKARSMNAVVEIGSWMGRSTKALITTGTPIISVDHFKGSASQINDVHAWAATNDLYKAFKLNVGHYPNLLVMRMDSSRAAQFFKDKSIDMIFIDGDHDYEMVKRDFFSWLPKCRKLMSGHDSTENGVPKLLEEAEKYLGKTISTEGAGGIWHVYL